MRFAIKTSPQHTTWADMLAVWQRPTTSTSSSRRGRSTTSTRSSPTRPARASRAWTTLTALAQATRAHPGRRARHRQHLPPPGGAREHGRHRRRHLRRPARARHRRGLERGGVRRLRHRPAAAEGAVRPLRRGLRGDRRPAHRHGRPTSTAATTSCTTPAASRSRCSGRIRRSASAAGARERTLRAVARWAQHWNVPGGRRRELSSKREVLGEHCADDRPRPVGDHDLDPPPARRRRRPRRVVDDGGVAEAGLDLGIVYLPPPTPEVLEPLADALATVE